MSNVLRYAMSGLLLATAMFVGSSQASVVIGGTRVVYPAQEREVTVRLTNEGKTPVLVQSWLDSGDDKSTPDTAKVPFTITPPINRLDAGKGQALRMVYTKEPLPTDKESLFWLNVLEVPPKAQATNERNLLQFAFRTRIKVFFRPDGLSGNATEASDKLTWKLVSGKDGKGFALEVSNPTPYYVNFASLGVKVGERSIQEQGGGMVAPGESATFPISALATRPGSNARALFTVINDYGALGEKEASLSP
ncbi:chaperone protein EcpD [Dyella sp. OK004]|uniref:fimbria/pilus periplasmic chaperone n=1 Tax=Dyella sp. OK004 TaxID=1855292 RepID=UPI0008EE2F7E|nr:fimbria/pilus periplasmic chaperone [Dyella sp. OK004]SFR95175.1 chaperone protein EcpD [Dyella sp. OK004]